MTSPGATNIEQRLARYRRMFDLSGKKALVLGAASGIGKASAEAARPSFAPTSTKPA